MIIGGELAIIDLKKMIRNYYSLIDPKIKKIEETSKEKHSLTRKLEVGIGGKGGVKRREQGFEKRVMRQKSYI